MPLASRTPLGLLAASVLVFAAAAAPPGAPAEKPAPREPERAKPAPAAEAGRVDLRPKFELGKVVRYTMKQVSDQQVPNAEDPKDPYKTRLEQTVGLKMTTKAVDKETGEATVELVYESVKAKLDSPLANVDFDSAKPEPKAPGKAPVPASDDPLDAVGTMVADQFKRMVGTTVTMKVAKDGRIVSVTGGESLAPTGIPGLTPATGDAAKNLGGLFGPITTNSTKGFDGLARVGERWTHRDGVSVGPLGELDMTTTYDLRSHASNLAKVYFAGRVESRTSTTGSQMPVGVEGAEHKGLYSWDTRLGQLVRCEMEQKVTLSGTLTGGQPSTATTTLVLDRVDKR